MEKMTKRNFYEALVNFANCGEFLYSADGTEVVVDNEAIIAQIKKIIGKIPHRLCALCIDKCEVS